MSDNKSHINPTSFVPPGRTLADMPKAEPKPAPTGFAKPANTNLTLLQMLTENGRKTYLVNFLREMGMKKNHGKNNKIPWAEYLQFFAENQSGDVESMSASVKAKCEKMVKDLNDAYLDTQDL